MRLGPVPLPIVGWTGMNIVGGFVAVHHIELLMGLQSQHMRFVLATFLLHHGRLCWRFKRAISQAIRNIDDHIGQITISVDNHVFGGRWCRMCLGAVWVGRHVNVRRLGRNAFELDDSFQ